MKTNFTRLLLLIALFLAVRQGSAQDAYRTNFATAVGQWTTPGNWERFDSGTSTWVTATAFPTAATATTITIQNGDSVQLTGGSAAITIDEVVIESGGNLVIFNTSGTVTLNDGTGTDMDVSGKLYISAGTTVSGTGSILVNSGALFTLRNSGVLNVPVTNNGTMNLGQPSVSAGTVLSTTITNNGDVLWIDGNFTLSTGASFVNTGNMNIAAPVTVNWASTGSNTITNTGSIIKSTTNTVNVVPALSNSGTIGGAGTYNFTTVTANTGLLSPGSSPGILTVSPSAISSRAPVVRIEVTGSSNTAGTDYDQLAVSGTVDITGSSLNFTDAGSAPVGTTYTIMTSSGTITGPFASTNVPGNYSIQYNASNIVLTKTTALPLTWGEFKAVAQGSKVLLDWTTLMEENTSHFVVEHSTNGSSFSPIADMAAQGNSTYEARYSFLFAGPDLSRVNYFRIKQFDLDGRSTYSAIRSVKFDKGLVVAIQAYPNPVKDVLQLNIQTNNIQVLLADQSGRAIQKLSLQAGQHTINMQSLPAGIYQLAFFEKGIRIESKQIIKQ